MFNLAEELGNASKVCKAIGESRNTFYRYQELIETGGIDSLINKSRRSPNVKNRTDIVTEQAVVAYAVDQPTHGQQSYEQSITQARLFISGRGCALYLVAK